MVSNTFSNTMLVKEYTIRLFVFFKHCGPSFYESLHKWSFLVNDLKRKLLRKKKLKGQVPFTFTMMNEMEMKSSSEKV